MMENKRIYNGIERPAFTPEMIQELRPDEVFVFGSNLEGMHGGGAAYVAWRKFGAVIGQGKLSSNEKIKFFGLSGINGSSPEISKICIEFNFLLSL